MKLSAIQYIDNILKYHEAVAKEKVRISPANLVEEIDRKEMVTDVAGIESKPAVGIPLLRSLVRDLAVFNNLELASDSAHDANCLRGDDLLHHLN